MILNARQKEEGVSCRISLSQKGRAKVSYLQTNVQVIQLKPNHFGLNNSKSNLEDTKKQLLYLQRKYIKIVETFVQDLDARC